jgi:hypothetical protein
MTSASFFEVASEGGALALERLSGPQEVQVSVPGW